uniref:Ornithine aminotransferase n=1 Tax=Lygus hesperus TaxID=30085 RepID=A0A0A9VV03_LYGHE
MGSMDQQPDTYLPLDLKQHSNDQHSNDEQDSNSSRTPQCPIRQQESNLKSGHSLDPTQSVCLDPNSIQCPDSKDISLYQSPWPNAKPDSVGMGSLIQNGLQPIATQTDRNRGTVPLKCMLGAFTIFFFVSFFGIFIFYF